MHRSLVDPNYKAEVAKKAKLKAIKQKRVGVGTVNFDADKIRERLSRDFPLGLVPRSEIEKATGGIYTPKTMANKDQDGSGIKEHVRLNKKICYPFDALIEFISRSAQKVEFVTPE